MKSKKVTMLAAALVVAVVAAAGIGYAAVTSYEAKTTNTNNNLASTYIELTQTGGDGIYATDEFLTNLYFNTNNINSATETYYTPVYTHKIADGKFVELSSTVTLGESDKGYALVTDPITLTIKKTNSNAATVEMDVTVTTLTVIPGLEYTMVFDDDAQGISATYKAVYNGTSWNVAGVPLSTGATTGTITYGVYIFVSLDNDHASGAVPGTTDPIATGGFSANASFLFKATVNLS